MKKYLKLLLAILLIATSSIIAVIPQQEMTTYADSATSYTMAIDARGQRLVRTQDAYLPNRSVIGKGLNALQDIIPLKNLADPKAKDLLYICGTYQNGNLTKKGIIVYNQDKADIEYYIEHEGFNSPTGLYIREIVNDISKPELNEYELYVADRSAYKIFIFNYNKTANKFIYAREISKPTSILFAGKEFNPVKITVDRQGTIYVLCGSVSNGIIQLDNNGEFLGYFSTNKVVLSLAERIQLFFGGKKENETKKEPPAFSNIFIDKDNMVYSTTSYATLEYQRIKKHNAAGKNILGGLSSVLLDTAPKDIYVDSTTGIIFVAMNSGRIYLYTAEGILLCVYGGVGAQAISGLFTKDGLNGICVDSAGVVWCVDAKGAIVSFNPTDYANLIFAALNQYYEGNYEASIAIWKEVLKLYQSSALAHNYIGINYLILRDYDQAMYHLKLSYDRYNYSQAYWEVRNEWLQSNLVTILIIAFALWVIVFVYKQVNKRTTVLSGVTNFKEKVSNYKLIKDLKFQTHMLKNSVDNFYYLKAKQKGSMLACTMMLLFCFIAYLFYSLGQGFLFQYLEAQDADLIALILGFFGIFFLVVFCNWLVTSIQDGEGNLGAIYRMACVSLMPWALSLVAITTLSHVLTFNEAFLLVVIKYLGIGLSGITFVVGIQETHYYTLKEAIISILLTILLIAVAVLVVLLITILATQLYQFVEVLVKEGIRNAKI